MPFFSSSSKKSDPLFVAATSAEKPFFAANFKRFFGESATWEEAIHGDTGARGFMLFTNLSPSVRTPLIERMRDEAIRSGISPHPSPRPSPRLSPIPSPSQIPASPGFPSHPSPRPSPRLSPHPSPRPSPHLSIPIEIGSSPQPCPSPLLLSPHPQYIPQQRPQLRINNCQNDDFYDPLLLQSGGLSPHFDSPFSDFGRSPSSNALELPIPSRNHHGHHRNLDLRQTRSMPSTPLSSSAPNHSSFLTAPSHGHPQPRHSHSRSANIEVSSVAGLFDVTNFWDESTRSDPACASSPVSSMPRPATAKSNGSIDAVVDCGLGLEQFADMFSGYQEQEEMEGVGAMKGSGRSRPPSILIDDGGMRPPVPEKDEKFRPGDRGVHELEARRKSDGGVPDVRMSPNMRGIDMADQVRRREIEMRERRKREMAGYVVPPPPRTRKELLELGWVKEKIVRPEERTEGWGGAY